MCAPYAWELSLTVAGVKLVINVELVKVVPPVTLSELNPISVLIQSSQALVQCLVLLRVVPGSELSVLISECHILTLMEA